MKRRNAGRGGLVLGLGNVLCRDDGVGIAALARLSREYRPGPGLGLVDGGTLGLALLPLLERAGAAVLVDAIRTDAPPSTLVRLEGEEVARAAAHRLSVHQIGVSDLLEGARLRGRLPPRLRLVGVVPASVELGLSRTPAIEAAIPALVQAIVDEVEALGYQLSRRSADDVACATGPDRDVHRVLGL